jgi:predicted dinucleotide-binding enzyme
VRIGIIGAGNIGATLARKFAAAGHQVLLTNLRGPGSFQELADEIGAQAVPLEDVVLGVDALVISIPQGRIPELPSFLFEILPSEAVVIDTGNYYPGFREEPIEAVEAGLPESQWVADQIGRPVIKAFNSIIAPSLAENGRERGQPDRIALPVAGDDARAKRLVIGLVSDAGFDGLDAGSLAESWRQQPGTRAYCTDLCADELRQALSEADRANAPRRRDAALAKLAQAPSAFAKEDVIRVNRDTF